MEHGFVLLGGDTVAPSGLCARLCHAFLVLHLVRFAYLIMNNKNEKREKKKFRVDQTLSVSVASNRCYAFVQSDAHHAPKIRLGEVGAKWHS